MLKIKSSKEIKSASAIEAKKLKSRLLSFINSLTVEDKNAIELMRNGVEGLDKISRLLPK